MKASRPVFFRRFSIAATLVGFAAITALATTGCDDRSPANNANNSNNANNDPADAANLSDTSDPNDTSNPGQDTSNPGQDTETDPNPGPSLCDRIELGPNSDLRGERFFPDDSYWNQPVLDAEVDPNSDAIIASIGADTGLHADFGCCWPDTPFGIPYVVVDSSTPQVPIQFDYASESDPGPYPIPPDAPIEGGPDATGDRHILAIDCATEQIYELFDAHPQTDGSWHAGSGAVWNLNQEPVRAPYCTSADAAGLPIFPGLARYDEVAAGEIRHALRFTAARTRRAFVRPPASHWASSHTDENLPPMGMRVRLKADAELGIDLSTFSEQARILIRAMQTYGMILADNGSNWYVSGAPSEHWNDSALSRELRQIKGHHFEVLKMDGLVTDYSLAPGSCQLP